MLLAYIERNCLIRGGEAAPYLLTGFFEIKNWIWERSWKWGRRETGWSLFTLWECTIHSHRSVICASFLSLYTNSLYTHPSSLFSVFGLYWEKLFDRGRRSRPIYTGPFYWKREMGDLSRNECHCDFMFLWLYGWMLYNDPFSQSSKDLLYNRLFCFVLCFWSILRETLWSGAAKPPHIYWPAFLKLKIESWETHYTLYNLLCIVDFVCIWEVLFAWGGEAAPYTLPFFCLLYTSPSPRD